jgi:beta-glucosidase
MRKIFLNISMAALVLCCISCSKKPELNKGNEIKKRAYEVLKKMTLEEKVGQMTQLDISYAMKEGKIIEESLDSIVSYYKVGSILGHGGMHLELNAWHDIINKIQTMALKTPNQIPVLYGVDAIHGATYTKDAVLFPHNIGVAATRKSEYGYQIARITSNDVLASGIRWVFDPVLDVMRTPLWPRVEETFGESVGMVTKFGEQVILGYEETNPGDSLKLASCMKHFLGYGAPFLGKDRTPAYIPDNILYQKILPPFEQGIKAGASTIMLNSGAINGIPVHANKNLLTDLLKSKMNFEGFAVTDWLDIKYLYTSHKVAANNKEAVAMAINAGVDMSMVPTELDFYYDLIDLVNEGKVPMERIDDAVLRILKVKFKLGLFDRPFAEENDKKLFGDPENEKLALQIARESMTLLKNEPVLNKAVLPLPKNAKVLIAGPATNSLSTLHGSWSYSWQGNEEELYPATTQTILQSIKAKIGASNVLSVNENGFENISAEYIGMARKKAVLVDYVILCLGEDSYAEGAGNINDLTLSKDQLQLAAAMNSTGKPVILVLTAGRPRIIADIEAGLKAVLLAYRPGSKGANAIADVLFGDFNPSGKLPFTYPKEVNNWVNFDDPVRMERFYKPQWPFGHGLSYSSFAYGEIKLSSDTLINNQKIDVSIDITNTSKIDGEVAIDLFVKDLVATITPPIKRHVDFNKVFLKAGETKNLLFSISPEQLSFVLPNLTRVVEEGEFEVMIENKKRKFYYKSNN